MRELEQAIKRLEAARSVVNGAQVNASYTANGLCGSALTPMKSQEMFVQGGIYAETSKASAFLLTAQIARHNAQDTLKLLEIEYPKIWQEVRDEYKLEDAGYENKKGQE